MFAIDMLFALVIALVLTGIFGLGFGRYGMGTTLAVFFIIVFFATWAGGVWILPFGPTIFSISWASFLIVGIVVSLILVAVIPSERFERSGSNANARSASKAYTIFFWILLAVLVVMIGIAYL